MDGLAEAWNFWTIIFALVFLLEIPLKNEILVKFLQGTLLFTLLQVNKCHEMEEIFYVL